SRRSRNWLCCFDGTRWGPAQCVDEILVSFKRPRFKIHVQQGIAWSKKTIDGAARGWRLEFAGSDKELVGIEKIAELPGAAHVLMALCELHRVVLGGLSGDFEMPEVAGPCLHGIRRDARIPVQFVNGEIAVFDAGQDRS